MAGPSDRAALSLNVDGVHVEVTVDDGETLLTLLRERLGIVSVKDGCAPQGQCGCCTVLVDGAPRVACVTPAARVAGRAVLTVEGLGASRRDRLAAAFVACGASQCGFCTPGILVRLAPLVAAGREPTRTELDRALAAHLCRCTGWLGIHAAARLAAGPRAGDAPPEGEISASAAHPDAAGPGALSFEAADEVGDALLGRKISPAAAHARSRAELETGGAQRVGVEAVLGAGGFADDSAPRGAAEALVAVPLPPGSPAEFVEAAGLRFVVAGTLADARARAGKVQGRRSTRGVRPPLAAPERPHGGVRLATSWVEPAYLEPDASWCAPGGEAATPLANGGAFGAKVVSLAPAAARELADRFGRLVRVVWSREDVVRLGPKRPPVALAALAADDRVVLTGRRARPLPATSPGNPYGLVVDDRSEACDVRLPTASLRAPWAETAVVVEGALTAADVDRAALVRDPLGRAVLLDACVRSPDGAWAGARVELDAETSGLRHVEVRLAAGAPLDPTVLRSYCIGASHQALGWVLSEGLAVDDDTGEIHDLTIRSFGIIRPKDMPPIDVTIIDDHRDPIPHATDAVFAAVAAATWIALGLPESWPALETPTSKRVRR